MTTSGVPLQALLVVDIQSTSVTGAGAVPGAAPLLDRTAGLIGRARESGALVVHIQNDGPAGAGDEPGTPGWELHLPVGPGEPVVRKSRDDGFEGTPLGGLLDGHGVRGLVVCGLMSEMCIQATVRGALARGLRVVLPYDAHGTHNIPAAPGISEEIPAATASRVAAWAVGNEAEVTTRAADVTFAPLARGARTDQG
ncbi:isochorismatase family protein [Streptomyces fulvorobeus]|uniref:Nicotinamidase-related amidase n=1 Tax=Streptomyces fulvorobeus TaxID=284028 RepID=A0A7J0CA09_9ACTN|nr:isochorismatase family protein [Streptomyces fulvorobeus]NYE42920.1 nicotinamidase-related amidase [Streptomyces fulvorobeus]GFM99349.1 hypothetical protein Sfulv_41600 [Streptomyces fulvorobeus]